MPSRPLEVFVRLERILGEVLADVGGDAGRVVDGRTGEVLAAVGTRSAEDVAGLLAAARTAPPRAGDLVVDTAGAVHVLRGIAGPFVHVRLAAGADLASARRALADPTLHAAVRASMSDPRGAAAAGVHRRPDIRLPRPRSSSGDRDIDGAGAHTDIPPIPPLPPAPPSTPTPATPPTAPDLSAVDAQPALASIGTPRVALSFGALAVHALGVDEAARLSVASWLRDVATMRRVLDGLSRLA